MADLVDEQEGAGGSPKIAAVAGAGPGAAAAGGSLGPAQRRPQAMSLSGMPIEGATAGVVPSSC